MKIRHFCKVSATGYTSEQWHSEIQPIFSINLGEYLFLYWYIGGQQILRQDIPL